MQIEFDPAKQARTLAERGLDFAGAAQVFEGVCLTVPDDRANYGEPRFLTIGLLICWSGPRAARPVASFQ